MQGIVYLMGCLFRHVLLKSVWVVSRDCLVIGIALVGSAQQGSTAPWTNLRGLSAISGTAPVHAVEEPSLPHENLRADAP
jgi:hypothetical protein